MSKNWDRLTTQITSNQETDNSGAFYSSYSEYSNQLPYMETTHIQRFFDAQCSKNNNLNANLVIDAARALMKWHAIARREDRVLEKMIDDAETRRLTLNSLSTRLNVFRRFVREFSASVWEMPSDDNDQSTDNAFPHVSFRSVDDDFSSSGGGRSIIDTTGSGQDDLKLDFNSPVQSLHNSFESKSDSPTGRVSGSGGHHMFPLMQSSPFPRILPAANDTLSTIVSQSISSRSVNAQSHSPSRSFNSADQEQSSISADGTLRVSNSIHTAPQYATIDSTAESLYNSVVSANTTTTSTPTSSDRSRNAGRGGHATRHRSILSDTSTNSTSDPVDFTPPPAGSARAPTRRLPDRRAANRRLFARLTPPGF